MTLNWKVGEIMKATNIIVKDYIWEGNYIFGTFYQVKDGKDFFILDDGDIYPLDELKKEYEVWELPSNEIISAFRKKFEG